jgi:hypothetical protein
MASKIQLTAKVVYATVEAAKIWKCYNCGEWMPWKVCHRQDFIKRKHDLVMALHELH